MRLLALIALMLATLPRLLPAQRIERSGVTMRELRTELARPAFEPAPEEERRMSDRVVWWAGGVVGGALGIVAGYNIGLARKSAGTKKRCSDTTAPLYNEEGAECMPPYIEAVLGGVIGFSLGAFVTLELVARNRLQVTLHGPGLQLLRRPVRSEKHPRLPLARTP